MKFLEKFALVIFSIIILLISVIGCLLLFNFMDVSVIINTIKGIMEVPNYTNIALVCFVIFMLLAIKCIFFRTADPNKSKDGILLENDNGKLLISKDTLENLVNGVSKTVEGAENITAKVSLDKEDNLKVDVTLYVHQDTIIKELSVGLQNKIKEAIKKSSDLDVKEVNIRVKNITPTNEIKQIAEKSEVKEANKEE